jgi:hypothetical protein
MQQPAMSAFAIVSGGVLRVFIGKFTRHVVSILQHNRRKQSNDSNPFVTPLSLPS